MENVMAHQQRNLKDSQRYLLDVHIHLRREEVEGPFQQPDLPLQSPVSRETERTQMVRTTKDVFDSLSSLEAFNQESSELRVQSQSKRCRRTNLLA